MSYTDQAFIRAYQSEAPKPTSQLAGQGVVHTLESHAHGPHAKFSGQKRPLSEAMRVDPASPQAPQPEASRTPASIVLEGLSLPSVATQLAAKCGDDYRRMMSFACRSGEVIGFLGAGSGVGCTTTTLAAALAVGALGEPVALIDAAPSEAGLAASLGILRAPSLAEVLSRGGMASEALVHSAEHGFSFGVAFPAAPYDEHSVSSALRSLTATHDAVLVDLGCDVESIATHPAQGADSLRLDAVVIVRQANHGEADVMFARRVLAASGQTVVGVIESFAA